MIVEDPVFLTLGEVIEIHRDQIERYGGDPGIRDLGLLQSAMATPVAGFGGRYLHTDLFEMAAAYLFHITHLSMVTNGQGQWRFSFPQRHRDRCR